MSPRAIAKCVTFGLNIRVTSTFVTIQSGSTGYLFEQERAPLSRQDVTGLYELYFCLRWTSC